MVKYDKKFMESDVGKLLYAKWARIRRTGCCHEWADDFMAFVKWSMDSGFKEGSTLKRYDKNEVYKPHNCYWAVYYQTTNVIYKATAFCYKWNKAVNRIREHYGMELLEVNEPDFTDKTCKDCVHYKVCRYKKDDSPICEDYLD